MSLIKPIKYKAGRELDKLIAKKFLNLDENVSVPFFSTNDADALNLWKKLRASGEWCCLEISSDYDFIWTVNLIPGHKLDPNDDECHTTIGWIDSESLAEAICNMVLYSIEWKENNVV